MHRCSRFICVWPFEDNFNTVSSKSIEGLMMDKEVCDYKISEYEKKPGKKVPVSPWIPKDVLQRVLDGKYPYPDTKEPLY